MHILKEWSYASKGEIDGTIFVVEHQYSYKCIAMSFLSSSLAWALIHVDNSFDIISRVDWRCIPCI
jgi:hypothetical protein